MKNVLRRVVLILFLLFFVPFFYLDAFSRESLTYGTSKVLLIHSYHPEYAWAQAITEGVKAGLQGKSVVLDIFYMDTKRYTSSEWMVETGKKARARIAEFKPDVVITADDNAQAFVARYYLNKQPSFVFCGVNGNPEDYGFPADNVTGIVERLYVNESLALLRKIVPSVKTVAVMSDLGKTSVGALTYIREHIQGVDVTDYKIIGDFSLWKKRVIEFNHKVDAVIFFTYHTLQQLPDSLSLNPEQVMRWTRENIKIPSVGFTDFSIRDGVLCGVVESGYENGFEAAEMAIRIINGEKPEMIPIKTAKKGISMINLKTARALGIAVSEKILGSIDVVINEE